MADLAFNVIGTKKMRVRNQQMYQEDSSFLHRGQMLRVLPAFERVVLAVVVVLCTCTTGCIDLSALTGDTLQTALEGPYIVGGTMQVNAETRSCSLFVEDSGVRYLLFQGPSMTNEDFDSLFQDGARVRLEIKRRSSLLTNCSGGTIAEVQEILELIPPPTG